jgi:hypothetical protein
MGVPQHTRPENHAPFPFGLGPSFHEYWILDGWDQPTVTSAHVTQRPPQPTLDNGWTLASMDSTSSPT